MSTVIAFPGAFSMANFLKPRSVAHGSRGEDGFLRPLDVDMDELELCAREASTESSAYLDTETGEVLVVVKGEPDEKMLRQRVRAERKRYPVVPAFGLSEERALLRDFLSRATQGSGRELLVRLVDEPGAFHACLTALKADAALWREWEKFEITGLRGKLLGWMAEHGVQPRFMISATADD